MHRRGMLGLLVGSLFRLCFHTRKRKRPNIHRILVVTWFSRKPFHLDLSPVSRFMGVLNSKEFFGHKPYELCLLDYSWRRHDHIGDAIDYVYENTLRFSCPREHSVSRIGSLDFHELLPPYDFIRYYTGEQERC